MKRKTKQSKTKQIICSAIVATMVMTPLQSVYAATETSTIDEIGTTIKINEVESNDPTTDIDWVEIINIGTENVDLSNWFITDNKDLERLEKNEEWRIAEETVLASGGILVIEHSDVLDNLSLGKEDSVILYNSSNQQQDAFSYSGHAVGTYSRVPDGTGEFVDQASTKGEHNIVEEEEQPEYKLVINEVNSSPDDWVEVMNLGTETMDLSGYEIRDNSNDHRWQFGEGAIVETGKLFVVEATTVGKVYNDEKDSYEEGTFESAIGIGSGDSIRLYDKEGNLLDECSWTEHASYDGDPALASIGRYPDGTGSFVLMKETKGTLNDWYKPQVVINEVESDCEDVVSDWVEVYNVGPSNVDISGWYLYDNDPVGHAADITPVAEGTVLAPGGFYTFEINKDFTFGLGKNDKVTIFNKDGVVIDEFEYSGHAEGVYARIPDGTGDFVDFATSTKGKLNIVTNPVVINEIESKDSNDGADWIELTNPTKDDIDVSGIVIKDNDDSHVFTIPEGTTISAYGFLVIDETALGFGLGGEDAVRLYEGEMLIGNVSWTAHANPTLGLYPDVNGTEYKNTKEATPGAINKFNDIPELIDWPGEGTTTIYDEDSTFLEDSSGLDFFNGQLYAVDNGTGEFWILDVEKDGEMSFANGFENGKRVRFQKDTENPTAAGPDAEGITVDGKGMVYLASERDNSVKGVNYNTILMVDPNAEGEDLIALMEWNLTDSLPQVSANMGIESVEWVSSEDVNGKLVDKNTNEVFSFANYSNATADGVFFVALEDNGHIYAYVLNNDGTCVQIADIDSKIGGAMALDYDTYENGLWVVSDNGYNNRAAKISFNGTTDVDIVHVNAPSGVDTTANNEGFAIAEYTYTKDGQRPVYRFLDGVTSGALSIGNLACDYNTAETPSIPSYNGGGSYTPSIPDVTVTSPNENVKITVKSITTSTLNDVKDLVADDENLAVIGGKDSAVQITAKEDGEVLDSFAQPVTVTVEVSKSALKDVADVDKLTLALVTKDENGNTTLEYVGGEYKASDSTFSAFVDKPGNYVLVQKANIVKMNLFIDNLASTINGETVTNDVAPYIANDRTMVPVAFIMNHLGCQVEWVNDERKVVITLPNSEELSMIIDQEISGFGAVPVIENDRTMVPIAYIAYAMDCHVMWVGDERQVVIVK